MAEPAVRKFLDPQVATRLMRQPLQARLPMVGNFSGLHKSPHRGSSVEFAEYRKYEPGDDIRRLDWRVYARTDRFYTKEFEADTNLRCYLVVDCSGSMGFADRHDSKLTYAQRLAATLAYVLVHQGDAAGLLVVGERAVFDIPPRRNPAHLQTIFDTLAKAEPRGQTALLSALHDLAEKVKPRALVLIFSDLFCDVESLLSCFQHLRFRKHDLGVFHLLDRAELAFDIDRPMRFLDMETPLSLLTEPAIIRRQYLEQLDAYLSRLRAGCAQFNADYRQVVTDEDYETVLSHFLVERARTKGVMKAT